MLEGARDRIHNQKFIFWQHLTKRKKKCLCTKSNYHEIIKGILYQYMCKDGWTGSYICAWKVI